MLFYALFALSAVLLSGVAVPMTYVRVGNWAERHYQGHDRTTLVNLYALTNACITGLCLVLFVASLP